MLDDGRDCGSCRIVNAISDLWINGEAVIGSDDALTLGVSSDPPRSDDSV
jgi:hypothetical protein